MFEEDKNDKIYNLFITSGIDESGEYSQFVEKLYSKNDFLWKESHIGNLKAIPNSFFNEIDVVIVLAGIYSKNKEDIDLIVKAAEDNETPIVLVRPYGLEEVPLNLENKSKGLVGWNANCIVDTIKGAL
ncbi:MAG: nuclease [Methanobacteriaceae archaeon]